MKARLSLPGWLKIVAAALLLLCAATVYLLRIGSDQVGGSPSGDHLARIEQSPHYIDGQFVNDLPTGTVTKDYWSKFIAYLSPDPARTPKTQLPTAPTRNLNAQSLDRVTWLGHATVLLQLDSIFLLTDPVFETHLPLLFGSTERFQPPPLARDSLPPIDLVLISHDHFDHLEQATVVWLSEHGARFVVPLGVGAHLEAWGIDGQRIVELDWWETYDYRSMTITCTPARHLSGRSLLHMYETLWASFAITSRHRRIFYSGDTGYSPHFEDIGKRLGPFDLTLMQLGAYDDAWPDIHLTPDQALSAHRDLRGRYLLPVHWGTYDVALHPWREPIDRLLSSFGVDTSAIIIPMLGQGVNLDQPPPFQPWWQELE